MERARYDQLAVGGGVNVGSVEGQVGEVELIFRRRRASGRQLLVALPQVSTVRRGKEPSIALKSPLPYSVGNLPHYHS